MLFNKDPTTNLAPYLKEMEAGERAWLIKYILYLIKQSGNENPNLEYVCMVLYIVDSFLRNRTIPCPEAVYSQTGIRGRNVYVNLIKYDAALLRIAHMVYENIHVFITSTLPPEFKD